MTDCLFLSPSICLSVLIFIFSLIHCLNNDNCTHEQHNSSHCSLLVTAQQHAMSCLWLSMMESTLYQFPNTLSILPYSSFWIKLVFSESDRVCSCQYTHCIFYVSLKLVQKYLPHFIANRIEKESNSCYFIHWYQFKCWTEITENRFLILWTHKCNKRISFSFEFEGVKVFSFFFFSYSQY